MRFTENKNKGITIVELAIAIAVIGLLVAGVLGGTNIIKAAKNRKIINEITYYNSAIKQFEEEYYYLAGDIPNASTYWPSVTLGNGNGDGLISWDTNVSPAQEDLYLWQHLSLSEIIQGGYTGQMDTGTTIRYGAKTNAPNSESYNNALFTFFRNNSPIYSKTSNHLKLSALSADGRPNVGFLTAKQAYYIDQKIDDSKPSSGLLYSYRNDSDSGCVDANSSASTADYSLATTDKTCQLIYWYE